MAGLAELIIGIVLFFVGIGMIAGAFVWKSRSDPTVGWTWEMILLLVGGIVIAIIGIVLVIIGYYRYTVSPKNIPVLLEQKHIDIRNSCENMNLDDLITALSNPEIKAYYYRYCDDIIRDKLPDLYYKIPNLQL